MTDTGRGEHDSEGGFEGLTQEEERKCDEAFSAFDKDNSGYIDA